MEEKWWRIGGALVELKPGAEFKDSVKLAWRNFPDLRSPGLYEFVYDGSYKASFDTIAERAKVKLSTGTVPEAKVSVEAQAHQQPKEKADATKQTNWTKSKDGIVGLLLRLKTNPMGRDDGLVLVAFLRNFSDKPISVLKPFSGPFVGMPVGLEVAGPKSKVKYIGPAVQPRPHVRGDFVYLSPGQVLEDEVWLDSALFAGVDEPGEYAVRFRYAITEPALKRQSDQNLWFGTVESETQAERTTKASVPPKASTSFTMTKTSFQFDPKTCVRGSAGLGWGLGSVRVNVLGREGDFCVFDYTNEVEGGYTIYRCRVRVDGPPVKVESTGGSIQTSFSLKDAHVLHHGNVHFEFGGAKNGPVWHQHGVPKTDFVNHYADITPGDGATAEAKRRVKIRFTVYTDRRFATPLPGSMGKTAEFMLDAKEIDAGLAVGQLLMYLGVHSKSLSARGGGCSLQHQTPRNTQGISSFSRNTHAKEHRLRLFKD